jgi:hypothetical protein
MLSTIILANEGCWSMEGASLIFFAEFKLHALVIPASRIFQLRDQVGYR